MADTQNVQTFAEKRLTISHETELLQSFVRINVDEFEPNEQDNRLDIHISANQKLDALQVDETTRHHQATESSDNTKSVQQVEEAQIRGKKRRKRVGHRHEEVYCDKDRAAAVNLGSKDIKQSLKLKRKQDRTLALRIPEEAEPGTFLALGNYGMGKGDLQIALDFISKALELDPMEKKSLVARSKCYILLGQPAKALEDAEMALTVDKHFLKAIYQKAEALYHLGNFEHSLVYFHRGLHIRPDNENFKLGVHKAQKAIENAIGSCFPSIKGSSKLSSMATPHANVSPTDTSSKIATVTPKSSQRTTPVNRTKSTKNSKLLRELGADKDYLEYLMNNPNIKCKFKEEDTTVAKCVQETVEYLNARQEFWRQQLPPHLK